MMTMIINNKAIMTHTFPLAWCVCVLYSLSISERHIGSVGLLRLLIVPTFGLSHTTSQSQTHKHTQTQTHS